MAKRALWVAMLVGGAGFAAYILAMYGGSAARGAWPMWNLVLRDLYAVGASLPTLFIGVHLLGGALLCLLGPLQLVPAIRTRRPAIHRGVGRAYVIAAIATGLAGNAFIFARGTVGGPAMSVAFSLYGWLLVGTALIARRAAKAGAMAAHRAWALRLFALGISSLLYRLEYGLWGATHGGLVGHTQTWDGPLDLVMDFFFYVPTLAVTEVYLRTRDRVGATPALRRLAVVGASLTALGFFVAVALVAMGWWLPAAQAANR